MEKLQGKIPSVRFPEFEGEYREYRLSELMDRYSENNRDEEFSIDDILSLSSTLGIVDRKELLEDTYDKVNHKNYKKTRLNDFVYGKSISASYPYGLFKVNNCRDGLLSSLYFTFKVYKNFNPSYLDRYFSYHNRANNFLKQYVLVGDRYITADANYLLSGKISLPSLPEQTRIASFFTVLDKKIAELKQKKNLLEQYKKGVMQKLFSQELRFKDENGKEFPKWEKKKLNKIAEIYDGTHQTPEYLEEGIPFYSVEHVTANNFQNTKFISKVVFDKENKRVKLEKGDILMTRIGDIGTSRLINWDVNASFYVSLALIKQSSKFNSEYLNQYISTRDFQSELWKRTIHVAFPQKINLGEIGDCFVLLPCMKEQSKIANFLSAIDDKINRTENQIRQTQEYKKGLLQNMFV
jgi:type I restriction enzyme S subunit